MWPLWKLDAPPPFQSLLLLFVQGLFWAECVSIFSEMCTLCHGSYWILCLVCLTVSLGQRFSLMPWTGRSPILCQGTLCVCWAKFQHSIRLQLCLCLHFLLEWSLKVSERWETGVLLGLSLHRHVYSRSPGICWSVLKLLWTVHPLDFHLSCWVSFLLLQLVLPP